MRHRHHLTVATLMVLAVVWAAGIGDAAAADTTGSIQGKVLDQNDNPIPGATVTLRSEGLVRERAVRTDSDGNYFAPALPPGDYTVLAQIDGYVTIQQDTEVLLNQVTPLSFNLQEGSMSETVVVIAGRPLVSKSATENTHNFRKDFTETIPVGRSYQSLVDLAPGVANTGSTTNGGNPNILGASRNMNMYVIDGINIRDPVTGTFAQNFNYDAVEEVEVKLTGVTAEYGRFQGGTINIITKSGANEFTGSARDNIDSPSFDARYTSKSNQEFGPSGPPPTGIPARGPRALRHDLDTSLGGPLVRNNAWFFLNYSRDETVQTEQLGDPTGGVNGDGTYADTFDGDTSLAKITWQVVNNQKLQYTYVEDPALTPRCYGQIFFGGPCYDTPFVDNQSQGGFSWQANWNAIWTPKTLMDTRISRLENSFLITPLTPQTIRPDLIFEGTNPAGNLGAGPAAGHAPTIDLTTGTLFDAPIFDDTPEARKREEYDVKVTQFFEGAGSHTMKIGANYKEDTRVGASILAGNGLIFTLGWDTIPDGLPGAAGGDPYDVNNRIYYFFYDFAPPGSGGPTSKETAVFVQDDWQIGQHVALNLGVRVEKFQEENDVGEKVIEQTDWAPRLGLTVDVQGNGKHLLKATAARYLNGTILTTLSPFVRAAGGQSAYDAYTNGNFPNPGPPDWQLAFEVRPDPDTSQFSPDLEQQFLDEVTLSYQTEPINDWGFGITGLYRKWDNVIGQSFSYDYTTGSPRQILLMDNKSDIEREYRGVILQAEKRFSDDWVFRGNVTFGEAEGNDDLETGFATFGAFPGVPQSTDNRDGVLSINEDFAAKLYGSYRLPIPGSRHLVDIGARVDWSAGNNFSGITESAVVVVGPGADGTQDNPLGSPGSGVTIDQTAQVDQYDEPRGSREIDDSWSLDLLTRYQLAFTKKATVEARVEVFNVTNEQKAVDVIDQTTAQGFGFPGSYTQLQDTRAYGFSLALIW